METPTPFDLNEAIRRWQQNLGKSPAFKADNLEELASHLRASVQKLKANGLSEEEAFLTATQRIGERGPLEREFVKVNPAATWSLPVILFWIVAGIYLFQVIFLLICGILVQRQMWEIREVRRLIAVPSVSINQIYQAFTSHHELPLSFAPILSIALVLVFILGVGSWKGGAFIRSFEHPMRPALGLAMLGLVVTPAAALAAVNLVLVLIMVLLARRGLRKTSPANQRSRP